MSGVSLHFIFNKQKIMAKELSLDYVTDLIEKDGIVKGLEYVVKSFLDAYELQVTKSGETQFTKWLIENEKEENKIMTDAEDEEVAKLLLINSMIDVDGFFYKLKKSIIRGGGPLAGIEGKDLEKLVNSIPR